MGTDLVVQDVKTEKLTRSLQESILTLLTFGGEKGQIASGLLTSKLFEPPYDDIADRAIDYRLRYREAPGKAHIDDLFDHVLNDPGNEKAGTYQRVLMLLYNQSQHINEDYIFSRVQEFIRRQTYKGIVYKSAMRIQQGGENVSDDVEALLLEAIRFQVDTMDLGVSLGDKNRALAFLDRAEADWCPTGIKELDRLELCPTRKEMLVYIGPRKSGKSMFLTNLTKQALKINWRVLDISLEMSEERKIQRIFQCIYAIAKRDEDFVQTLLDFDSLGRLTGFSHEKRRPTMALRDPKIRQFLHSKMDEWGTQLDNVRVKQFPTGALTFQKYISYLDMLEQAEGFVPDMSMIDMPWLMAKDPRDPRVSFGHNCEMLRGTAVERNHALVAPHQSNRPGETAKIIQATHAAEDISIIATADTVITYSATLDEKRLGLGRLFVSNARNEEDKQQILITQSYKTGQYVLQSAPARSDYWDLLKSSGVALAEDDSILEEGNIT